MPAFEYNALNAKSRQSKGIIEADSEKHARQLLREKSLFLTSIRELADKTSRRKKGKGFRFELFSSKLKTKDLISLTRQLANLLRAALPVDEALKTIAEHNNSAIKKNMSKARSQVVEGVPLSQALRDLDVFSEEYSATISAGERSGQLATILERMAEDMDRRSQFNNKMKTVMIYPASIALVSLLVVTTLLTYVVPQVVEVFINSNRTLPTLTLIMITISDFLREKGVVLLTLIVVFGVGFRFSLRSESIKKKWHVFLMKVPLVGKIFVGVNNAQFTRNFSLMQSAGVPVLETMKITASTLTCLPMQVGVLAASEMVREGSTIFNSLMRYKALPPMTLYMLASGEASGKISDMMERAAINQERELEDFTSTLLGIFEPAIILAMGGIVLLIVLSILLPIFELNQMLDV